jgi:hypothetical protein
MLPGHHVKGSLEVTLPDWLNPRMRPSATGVRDQGERQCGHPAVEMRRTSKPEPWATTTDLDASESTSTLAVRGPRWTNIRTSLLVGLPSRTATGASTADCIWSCEITPVASPIPSKHHCQPEGVSNVAIDATDPRPTTPGDKLVGADGVAESSNARVQSATVARAVGPLLRAVEYHSDPATTISTPQHSIHRRLR